MNRDLNEVENKSCRNLGRGGLSGGNGRAKALRLEHGCIYKGIKEAGVTLGCVSQGRVVEDEVRR